MKQLRRHSHFITGLFTGCPDKQAVPGRMHPPGALLAVLLAALLVAASIAPAAYAQQEGVALRATAGFDGYCKQEHWLPLQVEVANDGPDLEAAIEVRLPSTTADNTLYRQTVSLPNTARKRITMFVYPQSYLPSTLNVQLVSAGQELASTQVRLNCLDAGDRLYGVLAESLSAYSLLAAVAPPNGQAAVAQLSLETLPDQAPALEALDALIVSGVDTGRLTPAQRQALQAWLAGGGRLLVTGGPDWQPTAAGLEELLPLQRLRSVTLDDLSALAEWMPAEAEVEPLPGPVPATGGQPTPQAEVLVSQDDVAVLVRQAVGAGQVLFLAADPARAPLAGWNGLPELYRLLFAATEQGMNAGLNTYFAAQAVASLPGMQLPSAGLIIAFLFIYVLAIGPLNYLVLRLLKRRELAWVTIPVLILAFSLIAFLVGGRARGNRPALNRLAVVHAWPGVPVAQADGLLGVFSPRRAAYDLQLPPDFLAHPLDGNPLLMRQGGWQFDGDPVNGWRVPDLRLDVSGLNGLALQGVVPAPAIDSQLELAFSETAGAGAILQGTLTNGSVALQDAVLLAPGTVNHLGDLAPGEQRSLQTVLNASAQASYAGAARDPFSSGPAAVGLPSSDTPTINQILGVQDYTQDAQAYRRYSVLSSLAGDIANPAGVYLLGWSDTSPLEASLLNQAATHYDTTLFLYHLNPALVVANERIVLSPGMFTWRSLEGPAYGFNQPYGSYLPPLNSLSLAFQPALPVEFSAVDSILIHLESYGVQGPVGMEAALWDYANEDWLVLPELSWGDTQITEAGRFVSPQGEVRLRLSNDDGTDSVAIERADISLILEP